MSRFIFIFFLLLVCSHYICSYSSPFLLKRKNFSSPKVSTHTRTPFPCSNMHPRAPTSLYLRGGAISTTLGLSVPTLLEKLTQFTQHLTSTPTNLFNTLLVSLSLSVLAYKSLSNRQKQADANGQSSVMPAAVKSLQWRFLAVFWLLRMADWLQGPYFYEVFSTKTLNGLPASPSLVTTLFFVGFLTTGLMGPLMGRCVDSIGRKWGTLAFALFTSLSSFSTLLPLDGAWGSLGVWGGRIAGGLGTSLLFCAPEGWLVGEVRRLDTEASTNQTIQASRTSSSPSSYLPQLFSAAYAGDSVVAILAGIIAGWGAGGGAGSVGIKPGPTAPFMLSVGVLSVAAVLVSALWRENTASPATKAPTTTPSDTSTDTQAPTSKATISSAVRLIFTNPQILLLGAVQALFEGAMYIFVLQWPPAMRRAIEGWVGTASAASGVGVPYGGIFSCFMACCLLGSTVFSGVNSAQKKAVDEGKARFSLSSVLPRSVESFMFSLLLLSALSLLTAGGVMGGMLPLALAPASTLGLLTLAFFLFEMCVGGYFPAIGTLRARYLPDSHRSTLITLFGVPLYALVISVASNIHRMGGVSGALLCAGTALSVAGGCMGGLMRWKQRGGQAARE